ncbi:hypothetical protein phiOC_p162 [Ochrobactrum phage vB_OspM_OC]|nr:hypothetical protein phiOC_p162 [Ochrobactrum phage vB_OspM_OC]
MKFVYFKLIDQHLKTGFIPSRNGLTTQNIAHLIKRKNIGYCTTRQKAI